MRFRHASALALLGVLAVAGAGNPALAANEPRTQSRSTAAMPASDDRMADQLNAQSLARAQANLDSPTPGPDTTARLNRMSERRAEQNRDTGDKPLLPFR